MFAFVKNAALVFLYILFFSKSYSQGLELKRVDLSVYFGFDDFNLNYSAKEIIDQAFPWESTFYPESILLAGFTDNFGSNSYNKELANRRAQEVKAYISDNHVSNTVFETTSIGEDQPAYDCNFTLNRCVKLTMYLRKKESPVSLKRCKELFPEEFSISAPSVIKDSIHETEIPELEITSDLNENTFHEKMESGEAKMIQLSDILFYGNSDRYYKSALPELEQLAEFLNAKPSFSITITGHVNGGKNSSRQLRKESSFQDVYDLSLARADAIKLFLIENGISPSRITAIGKGGKEPLYKKPLDQAQNEANRRIEITFYDAEN